LLAHRANPDIARHQGDLMAKSKSVIVNQKPKSDQLQLPDGGRITNLSELSRVFSCQPSGPRFLAGLIEVLRQRNDVNDPEAQLRLHMFFKRIDAQRLVNQELDRLPQEDLYYLAEQLAIDAMQPISNRDPDKSRMLKELLRQARERQAATRKLSRQQENPWKECIIRCYFEEKIVNQKEVYRRIKRDWPHVTYNNVRAVISRERSKRRK
jgi:hypothetical protein